MTVDTDIDTYAVTAVQVGSPADAEPDTLAVRDTAVPGPSTDQVRIEVRAAGVNPTDWKSLLGAWPREQAQPVGFDAAGVVTAIGGGGVQAGDEVIVFPAPGAYASQLVVPVDAVVPKPRRLSFAQAANLLLAGTTAAEMLHTVPPGADEAVLVHGASGATEVSLLHLEVRLRRNPDIAVQYADVVQAV